MRPEGSTIERATRARRVIEDAKANGETLPAGVALVDFRSPSEEERAHGESLDIKAREILTQKKVA